MNFADIEKGMNALGEKVCFNIFITMNTEYFPFTIFIFYYSLVNIILLQIYTGTYRIFSHRRYGWWYIYYIQWWCVWIFDGNTNYQPTAISYPWHAWNI